MTAARALHFPQLERTILAEPEETVYHAARRHGVRIVGACGGRGSCGSCVVRVVDGRVRHDVGDRGIRQDGKRWVRACRARVVADATIEVAPRSLAPVVRTDAEGHADADADDDAYPIDPPVRLIEVSVTAATLADPRSDEQRLLAALGGQADRLDLAAARLLPTMLRAQDGRVAVLVCDRSVIGVLPAGARPLGLAVDLGTTNIAAFLIDLADGRRLASLSIENPQTAWGADLIARVNHAIRDAQAAEALRAAAVEAINALAHDLCQDQGCGTDAIADIVIAGNSAMGHLLCGLPVAQLGRAPFVAAVGSAIEAKARDIGLTAAPGAAVHLAANIGGFVGGDHVTALLATEPVWRDRGRCIVMDIGTNTEISLIAGGRILSASCPSGPALEGGNIACGMRAAEGAIEGVKIGADGRVVLATIGNAAPVGICGSGVIDAVAALRAGGALDARGRLQAGHPAVVDEDGRRRAQLAPDIALTQDDIRAIQLAKAAIRTGVDLLLAEAGLTEAEIDGFIIAGAFGAYIALEAAIAIGLLPDLPRSRFRQVGNAAGLGVRQMLRARPARARAGELAAEARYLELSSRPEFQKQFLRRIGFGDEKTK